MIDLRSLRLVATLLAASLLVALASATDARATYEARAFLDGDYFRGAFDQLGSDTLYAYYWPANWAKNALWTIDPSNNLIEAGQMVGTNTTGGCDFQTQETIAAYWADERPGSQYYCHIGPADLEGATYGTVIYQTAYLGTTWAVATGYFTGTSTQSIDEATEITAGNTTTSQASTLCSWSLALGYWDQNDNPIEYWHDSSHGNAKIGQSAPPYGEFTGENANGYPEDFLGQGPHYDESDC